MIIIDPLKSFNLSSLKFDVNSCLGANGIYLLEEQKDGTVVLNKGGTCRDNFFRKLFRHLATFKGGHVNLHFAVGHGGQYGKNITSFMSTVNDIPYAKDIEISCLKDAIICPKTEYRYDPYGNEVSSKNKEVTLPFKFVKASFPYSLFANPATIWVLTYILRFELNGTTTGDYAPFYKPMLNLLQTRYFDLILTDKHKLIQGLWSSDMVKGMESEIIQYNGPYGVKSWLAHAKLYKEHPAYREAIGKFYAVHKYMNLDVFDSHVPSIR